MSKDLPRLVASLVDSGSLSSSTANNLLGFLQSENDPLSTRVIEELITGAHFSELEDRFFRHLSFGTGGLRGRTIGRLITASEKGNSPAGQPPQHPCVGLNAMNFFNVSRATQGLAAFLLDKPDAGRKRKPRVCIAHDTRYFSRDFAEFSAKIFTQLGCDVFLFSAHRSTPELSFAIRRLDADAGIVITASHNPPSYNGYKVYSSDGGQIVEPQASEIIGFVKRVTKSSWDPLPAEQQGTLLMIGEEMDSLYLAALRSVVLRKEVFTPSGSLRVVFSSLHGTGGVIIPPLLRGLGVEVRTVSEQDSPDGGFPTVSSPNPEEPSAMNLGLLLASESGADIVLATDPDADRVGVAARMPDGKLQLLSGNQIGSLLAWYRTKTFFDLGTLDAKNAPSATLVKTVVTTDLQRSIADYYGVRCVETLTGFKFIGAKLQKYESLLPPDVRTAPAETDASTLALNYLRHSTFFVFGGEESYGYSGSECVRDKDANMSALMISEVAAWAKEQGKTLFDLLDDLYLQFGLFLERGESLVFEGAEGAQSIQNLVDSYTQNPPGSLVGRSVVKITDYRTGTITDSEGDLLPKEALLIFELEGGSRVAVRPSGTEPKIKFYLFLRKDTLQVSGRSELASIKAEAALEIDALWAGVHDDAVRRVHQH